MAKSVEIELGGQSWAMPASYKASREVAQKVRDPLQMAVEAYNGSGSINLTVEDVVTIIAIGVRAAGCSLSHDEIGELVVDGGVAEYMGKVSAYLAAMVSGGPEKQKAASGKK